jgi:hypothetical protein
MNYKIKNKIDKEKINHQLETMEREYVTLQRIGAIKSAEKMRKKYWELKRKI